MASFVKKDAITYAWETVKNNLKTILIFAVVIFIINAIPEVIKGLLTEQMENNPTSPILGLTYGLVTIVSAILNMIISIGMIRFSLKFVDGKKGELSDIFATNKTEVWHYFLGSLLYGLRVLLGFILLIVPGIIWSIKYSQYSYLIVDKGLSPKEAIKKSGEITEGNKMNLFLLGILLALINVAGLIALFLGLFITIPLTLLAQAYVYRRLAKAVSHTPAETPKV